MPRLIVTSILLTSLAAAALASETQPAQASPATVQTKHLDTLQWLIGEWRGETPRAISTESWTRVSDSTFDGAGAQIDQESKQVVSREDLRLVAMGGEIFYLAKVAENAMPIPFKLVRHDSHEAVFENPTHNFPTRLIYKLSDDAKTLAVRVEGPGKDGKMRGFDLAFSRLTK